MRTLLALVAILALAGCATVMNGTTQEIAVSSSPSAAKVSVDGVQSGVTPVSLDLKRKDKHTIRIELEGYQPYELMLNRKVSNWVWGNIIIGGIPGLAVDAITGSLYTFTPDTVDATLVKATATAETDNLFVMVILEPTPDMVKIGQLER